MTIVIFVLLVIAAPFIWRLHCRCRRWAAGYWNAFSVVKVTLGEGGLSQEIVATLPEVRAKAYVQRELDGSSFGTDWYLLPAGQPLLKAGI